MKTRFRYLLSGVAIASLCGVAVSTAFSEEAAFKLPPRNVILLVGDGMDDQQITAARNYLVGAAGYLNMDRLPKHSTAQVLTIEEDAPHRVAYVADSANGGTSLATGAVTSTGRISTTVDDKDAPTILELAKSAGYKVGVVTTAQITDATPAVFLSHVSSRGCEGPSDMKPRTAGGPPGGPAGAPPGAGGPPAGGPGSGIAGMPVMGGCPSDLKSAGGKGSVAEQIATSGADVVLGGGTDKFNQTIEEGGKTVLQLAQDNGFHYVNTAADLKAASGRVLGMFARSVLPVKFMGPAATRMTFDASGASTTPLPEVGTCSDNPDFNTAPSLAAMTAKAVELLSKNNKKGFFLMVESASIDKQAHGRNACGHIGEMAQLDEVVQLIRNYAKDDAGTLVIVTADHGHSVQVLNDSAGSVPMGYVTRITTKDGSVLRIGYATNSGRQEEHTGTEVPVLIAGGSKSLSIPGFMHQTEIFTLMAQQLGLRTK